MKAGAKAASGVSATTAVLWLMILIVFMPIALAHGAALLVESRGDETAVASAPQ